MKPSVGKGIYTAKEAAKMIGSNSATVSRWFADRSDRPHLLDSDFDKVGQLHALSFLDLIDALVVKTLKDRGFSAHYIRKFHAALVKRQGNKHAFATHSIVTTGFEVFVKEADTVQDKAVLIDVLKNNQLVHEGILKTFLSDVVFDESKPNGFATAWHPMEGIVVRPDLNFGAPTVESTGIVAQILADAWKANDCDDEVVADWYSVKPESVRVARTFIFGAAA